MKELLNQALAEGPRMIELRRALHQVPELDLHLPKTAAVVQKALRELQIPFQTFPDHAGLVALIEGKKPGKTVALRADMDALPMQELAALPYASQNGNMHACGHDAHMAMLLGAAALLMQNREDLQGRVKLLFQPGEEKSGGSMRMVEAGVLENPPVDIIFGQHAGLLSPELPAGCFGFLPGPFMASRDSFIITVRGKGCHGALPAEGVDPIVVAAQIITALQTLISREIHGHDIAVLTIGAIKGGEAYNIIPETVEMIGAIRCLDEEKRAYLLRRIHQLCQGICESMRATCTIEEESGGYPVTFNDADATCFAMACAEKLFGKERVHLLKKPLMVSEDMSFFLQERPGSYWLFATPCQGEEEYPNHSPYFSIDDSVLYEGAALLAAVTLEWLKENS